MGEPLDGSHRRVEFAIAAEERIPVLERCEPGRRLHTNLEWSAAIGMEACGLERELCTPTFAAARVLGCSAHVLEQAADHKIIRPAARSVGPPAPQPVPSDPSLLGAPGPAPPA